MSPAPLFDDHVHSCHSSDAREPILALCRAALAGGLAGLTITDHFDTEPTDPGYGWYDYDRIRQDVEAARDACGPDLQVLAGAEVCFQPEYARRIAGFLQACPLDYCLGSVHYVRHEYVEPAYFQRHGERAAYEAYFAAVEEAATSGLFDAVGHLDVAKRYAPEGYGPFEPRCYWGQIERILQLMVERGVALEINTSGWYQQPAAPYPGEEVVRRFAELGGTRLTIGSDAHRAPRVGRGIARAQELARRAGFTHLTHFVGRQARLYPL